jgi:predicted Zn-dependent protease
MRSEKFKGLVEKNPGNELFRFSLAQALIQENRFTEAEPHLRVCIEKKPDWMMAHIALGKTLLELGRPEEALPTLKDAHRLAIEQEHEEPEAELSALLNQMR